MGLVKKVGQIWKKTGWCVMCRRAKKRRHAPWEPRLDARVVWWEFSVEVVAAAAKSAALARVAGLAARPPRKAKDTASNLAAESAY